jgi:hypothetical protein
VTMRHAFVLLLAASTVLCHQAVAQEVRSLPDSCRATTPQAIRQSMGRALSCGFDRETMSYAGTPVQQARCLLRPVLIRGEIEQTVTPLPESLEQLVGQAVGIPASRLAAYLDQERIPPGELGGPLTSPLSRTTDGHRARYFVIHDTSYPLGADPFAPDMERRELAG